MSEISENNTPTSYWVVTGLLVVWSLMGIMAYLGNVGMSAEDLAKYVAEGDMTQGYADYIASAPAWTTAVFAVAVFSGVAGAICLLLRKKWAVQLYTVSLVFILISMFKGFVLDRAGSIMSAGQIFMEFMVVILGIIAVWFSRKKRSAGIIK
ncbi:MAG: hypothetical protein EX271_13235 [Acidimicrobiales bacterium]|nr:hypothetical protein [Hyphomonadaceae bacterium]RZV34947.1 MAG: hypothetical protein EX271_13235 [Acidimicrobiales bacterium]